MVNHFPLSGPATLMVTLFEQHFWQFAGWRWPPASMVIWVTWNSWQFSPGDMSAGAEQIGLAFVLDVCIFVEQDTLFEPSGPNMAATVTVHHGASNCVDNTYHAGSLTLRDTNMWHDNK